MTSLDSRSRLSQCLVERFGRRWAGARAAVAALYESLGDAASDGPVMALRSCGREHTSRCSAVARRFGLAEKHLSIERLTASLEVYYATVIRMVVDRALGAAGCASDGWDACGREPVARAAPWLAMVEEGVARFVAFGSSEAPRAVDWFGPLYQDLYPRSLRHALGEYYTPAWLAEHVLDTVGYLGLEQREQWQDASGAGAFRLLDPTCGSGVFLLAAIGRIRAAAGGDVAPEELGRRILQNVIGYDVNPMAVLTARANYLLAIRDLLPSRPPCPAPPVFLRDVILEPAEADGSFDYVVGNPPWVAWDNLPAEYRARTKPLWQRYGLFSLSATQARHGGGKKDLSMLVLCSAADRHLRLGGRLGFVITQTLFQTKGAGDGFRHFRLGEDGQPLGVYRGDDLTAVRPFAGASNWTAAVALEKGRRTVYPVSYVKWHAGSRVSACHARPIDPARPSSPWIVLPVGLEGNLAELTGRSDYTANLGANSGGANGVYWVEVIGPADESRVLIRNLAGAGKRLVEQVETQIEPDLLYPLVRWSDLRRWRAAPSAHLLLAQDVETRSGIDEATMRRRWPKTLAYLARFRELLAHRAAYRRYQSAGAYWSMYNIGPYTLAPIKVVWRRMDRRINAAVAEPVDDPVLGRRPVVVQETCVQVAVESSDEAHYLAAVLNSGPVNFLVTAHSVLGGKGFGTPSMLDYLNLRRFDAGDERHCRLSELSREAHRLATTVRDMANVQKEIDGLAGRLWGLSGDERAVVEEYLAQA